MKPIYININININCFKETPYARKLRIAETENGRKLRGRIVEAKKKYKRSREIPDFDFSKKTYLKLAMAEDHCHSWQSSLICLPAS